METYSVSKWARHADYGSAQPEPVRDGTGSGLMTPGPDPTRPDPVSSPRCEVGRSVVGPQYID